MSRTPVAVSLLRERDVALCLNVSLHLLRKWRRTKKGPPWLKLGRAVRYSDVELQRWLSTKSAANRSERTKNERRAIP